MEGKGLLRRRNDLLRRQEEAVEAGVPQLHADRHEDAGHTMSPVDGAAAGRVEEAGDAAHVVRLAVDSLQCSLAPDCDLQHLVVVARLLVRVSPGEQHQLAVAVDVVEEDPVSLPLHHVAELHLDDPGLLLDLVLASLVLLQELAGDLLGLDQGLLRVVPVSNTDVVTSNIVSLLVSLTIIINLQSYHNETENQYLYSQTNHDSALISQLGSDC